MNEQTYTQAIEPQVSLHKQVFMVLLATAIMMLMVQSAYAISSPMGDVLCRIVSLVYGNLGRGIATLAVIVVGVGATLGKTSWGLAMTVAVGIAVIFNASGVVTYLGNNAVGC